MYPVSEAFLRAVQENTRRYYWTGRITTTAGAVYEFGSEDIVKGSGYISSQCCGNTEIELGTVYSSEMGITLFLDVDRYSLEDAIVELFYHLRLGNGSYETVPMGIFEVSEANRNIRCLELKAYDYMLRFEKKFKNFESTGQAYDFLNLCCEKCKVELAHAREEIEAMPNGAEVLAIYGENDIETYRDVLYYLGQVLGGFFVINRKGQLELRKYGAVSVMEVEQKHRFSSSFSDFVTRYTAISSTNLRTKMAEYYALEEDNALTMNLGINPFLQFGLEETREKLCRNILNDISEICYVPFDSETIGNPALELGDVLRFSGGQADGEQITCVTSCEIKIGGRQRLRCVGKNPRLAQAKSKNDKNIAGLLNQVEAGKVGFFSFTNAKKLSLGEAEVKGVSIEFVAGEVTQAEFIGLVVLDVVADAVIRESAAVGTITVPVPEGSGSTNVAVDVSLPIRWVEDGRAVVKARYVLNDRDIELFYPMESYDSGKHTFALYYPVGNVLPNLMNTFEVFFSVTGGTAAVEEGGCIATINGQGMAAQAEKEWDGNLEIEETIGLYSVFAGAKLKAFVSDISVAQMEPALVGMQEVVQRFRMRGFPMEIGGV